ncbi:MAG: heme exporter protein CcmD [Comamonadaceae bacterium]|nr:heme exporter protein CcmD [Comamonadaceae bacterium]
MGGYGFYVWGSYGVTPALIAGRDLLLLRAAPTRRCARAPRSASDRGVPT